MKLTGWHGTTSRRKSEILSNGFEYKTYNSGKEKERHPNDLGNGSYFFLSFGHDSGENIATAFVKKYKSNELTEKDVKVALIKVELNFDSKERIFDLDEEKNQLLLEEYRNKFVEEVSKYLQNIKDDGAKRRASRLNQNQGLLIELFLDLAKTYGKTFDAVQDTTYTEVVGVPIIDGKNGLEICVRDSQCISIQDI